MKMVKTRWFELGLAVAPLLAAAACSSSNTAPLSLALSSREAPAAPLASAAFTSSPAASPSVMSVAESTVIALGGDTIVVRSVELVLREIELKRVEVAACDAVEGNGDCEEFETGPVLVTLPLGAANTRQDITVNAPAGMYDKLEFEVHKPDASSDAAFIATLPAGFPSGASIRVQGTFVQGSGSGPGARTDFTFTSDVNQSEEMNLVPPLTVAAGAAANVTLRVDISTWYLNAGRTALVNPATANKGGANESVVANNIQNSFKAFRDNNENGLDDDNEGS